MNKRLMNIINKIYLEYKISKSKGKSLASFLYYSLFRRVAKKLFTKRVYINSNGKKTCIIHHVFFHSLVLDPEKAFKEVHDNSHNFEDWFVTRDEFKCFLNQVYKKGYILVKMSELLHGKIQLPSGKIPLVISFDDMNYYDYMKGWGFATKLELDKQDDTVTVLEDFIHTHPDFSFKGSRGIIALTGYEGALGYRDTTDPELISTIKSLKALGYEFACHSWGHSHRIYSNTDSNGRKGITDMKKWFSGVGKAVGKTDIFITPFGVDIRNSPILHKYLKLKGFRYFCSVGRTHRIDRRGNCFYIERYNIDGRSLRTQDYDYNMYYGSVEELYSAKRKTPYSPLAMNASSLVKHGEFCLTFPNIYCWNFMGEVLNHEHIRGARRLYPRAYTPIKCLKFMLLSDGEIRAFDCSGLIKNYLMGGLYSFHYNPEFDFNSAGLLEHSKRSGDILNIPEIPGICLYMQGHVGIYIGNGRVIECTSNRKFGNGVVMTGINDRIWLKWFYCPGINYGGTD